MEELFLGLSLVFIFALCFFAVERFGRRMEKSCKAAPEREADGGEPSPQQRASVLYIAADSRAFDRLQRDTEHEKINLM